MVDTTPAAKPKDEPKPAIRSRRGVASGSHVPIITVHSSKPPEEPTSD